MLGLRNFGEKSYWELMDRLLEMGLIADDDPRVQRSRDGALLEAAAEDVPPSDGSAEPQAATPITEADEEISSLGSALLEALREAGQDPDAVH